MVTLLRSRGGVYEHIKCLRIHLGVTATRKESSTCCGASEAAAVADPDEERFFGQLGVAPSLLSVNRSQLISSQENTSSSKRK